MRKALIVLVAVWMMLAHVSVGRSSYLENAIIDPNDVHLGMDKRRVTAALQACCAGRPEGPGLATDIWDAEDGTGQLWRVVFHNGVVVEITHDIRSVGTLSAVELLQLVTNDLVQHCPSDSRNIPGKRGPGYLDASAYQYGSPDLQNERKINWRSSVSFSCGNHMVSILELGNDRVQVSFGDAVPNPMAPNGFSLKPAH